MLVIDFRDDKFYLKGTLVAFSDGNQKLTKEAFCKANRVHKSAILPKKPKISDPNSVSERTLRQNTLLKGLDQVYYIYKIRTNLDWVCALIFGAHLPIEKGVFSSSWQIFRWIFLVFFLRTYSPSVTIAAIYKD